MLTHRLRTGFPAAAACLALLAAAPATADLNDEISDLIDNNVTGGVSGFRLKRVDGPVLASWNSNYLFYPASTIKVVQHVHAMRMVEIPNGIDLNTVVTVYDIAAESCDDDHTGDTPTFRTLGTVLQRMMVNSDNQDTNAVQELFGRPAINLTAQNLIGMSNTQLEHKFGCGGPSNDPANQMPLVDATLLYEQVALGNVFGFPGTRTTFYGLMNNAGNWFDDVIDQEAPEGMTNGTLNSFKAQVQVAWKGGNIGTSYISLAGWVQLPSHPCSGEDPRDYAFGVFFDDIDSIDANFGTKDVADELLRDEIRSALQAWQACAACGTGGACDQTHAAAGCDDAECCAAVCAVDSLCCQLSWDASCVFLAIELCGLAPDNDDCGDASPITNGFTGYSIANASNDGPSQFGECNWNTEFTKDIWYEYTAECTGYLTLSACTDTTFTSWVGIYSDCDCPQGQLDLLACTQANADCGGGTGTLQNIYVETGNCYKIRVAAVNPSQGSGLIHIECEALWDDCADAFVLGAYEGSVNIDTNGATTDGPAHNACSYSGDNQVNQDIWFNWTAPCTGTLTVDTCNDADFDTKLAVYAGCACPVSNATLLGCNDDAPGCGGLTSRLSVPVQAGQCYKIRVGGFGSAEGTGDLNISCAPTPANDDCENAALTFLGQPTPFSTLNATTDGEHHGECSSQILRDVWFRRTATCTGTMTVTTCGSADFDTMIAVYDGCECPAGDETLLGCNDNADGCADQGSEVTVPVIEGQCYLVRIGAPPIPVLGGEPPSETGTGTVDFICTPACPATCIADVTGDCQVNIDDLVAVIIAWGTPDVAADINDDGLVDVDDLVMVILAWGPC